ncbi:MAG: SDR family oxidoreductase [Novosphingobium sp.]|uniref:SDR family oxidoreductase n=1 Tax=Novosphingobium sp. TaxID=1874826 RepID=UPI001DEC1B7F|nr:SDR family oxidoreductase [Novosphingobium sp.]MCB2056787.1 SDR family oxidoreductase [Novosphingobium sp.]MCP5387775.1 SDR family oxidoreductase [Novosphingobium sp.]
MDLRIAGKKAIMAGGSAGMGRATAERLAEAGVELFITARREERLVNAAREIADKYGTKVTPVVADSSTEEGRSALFAACPDPDILSITIKPPEPNGNFLELTPEMWRASIETALIGPIEIMRHYIPGMKDRKWGRIVNIATFSAKNLMIWRLMSGPARSALLNYTGCVAREVAPHGVVMNNLLPGLFATEGAQEVMVSYAKAFNLVPDPAVVRKHFLESNYVPTGFIGEADDLAAMAAFLCSELARFIVGQNIVIDGGQHRSIF